MSMRTNHSNIEASGCCVYNLHCLDECKIPLNQSFRRMCRFILSMTRGSFDPAKG